MTPLFQALETAALALYNEKTPDEKPAALYVSDAIFCRLCDGWPLHVLHAPIVPSDTSELRIAGMTIMRHPEE